MRSVCLGLSGFLLVACGIQRRRLVESMAKKRKSVASRLDEVDRTMHSTFCSTANSLSLLYTQAMNQQKVSFQAGERHALEELYQCILRQHEDGSRVTSADIVSYLQNKLDYGGEDAPTSPRLPLQHHFQPTSCYANSGNQAPSVSFGQATCGYGPRPGNSSDQTKNPVFSSALSSPIRRSLQPYQLAPGGVYSPNNVLPSGNGPRNSEGSHSLSSTDMYMDMHSDDPAHEPY